MIKRKITIDGDVAYIPLTKGYTAIIDTCDLHIVEGMNWQSFVTFKSDGTIRTVYAVLSNGGEFMHRLIMSASYGVKVDHKDGNGLDCRRSNMRLADSSQNSRNMKTPSHNTSGHKGVYWHKPSSKWRSFINVNNKQISLGYFSKIEDAIAAYADASMKYHGEFGRTK